MAVLYQLKLSTWHTYEVCFISYYLGMCCMCIMNCFYTSIETWQLTSASLSVIHSPVCSTVFYFLWRMVTLRSTSNFFIFFTASSREGHVGSNIFTKLSFLQGVQRKSGPSTGEITNKMQPCNRIYYSTVLWRLNKFWAAHRSSSGALTVFAASGLHKHVVNGRSEVGVGTPTQTWLRPVTTCLCKPEAANAVRAPDDERCAARNMLSLQ
jgi:hypothetical protein